jgi:hypothetical protein
MNTDGFIRLDELCSSVVSYKFRIVTAQAEAFAVGNSAKKVYVWSVRSTRTPFLRIPLPQAEQLLRILSINRVAAWVIA